MDKSDCKKLSKTYKLYDFDNFVENKDILNCPLLVTKETSIILQEIYKKLKESECAIELSARITSSIEYMYIIKNLYGWAKKNKLFGPLVEFYIQTVTNYEIRYNHLSEFLKNAYEKYQRKDIISNTASSLNQDDIIDFINDFKFINEEILFNGFIDKLNRNEISANLIENMVNSGDIIQETIGAKCYEYLQDPLFNLNHLLNHTKDEVVFQAVKQLAGSNNNECLLEIIFKRGHLDLLTAASIKKLNINTLSQKDLERIYSFFHISPLNYIKFKIYKYGFELNEQMVLDLIKTLENLYSEDLFGEITQLIKNFNFTQSCHNQIISSLNISNNYFKKWAVKVLSTENITLPYFIKFCWFIANEDDLDVLEEALIVLKLGKIFDIVDKWVLMKKFERLTRRIYPCKMTDCNLYKKIYNQCRSTEEKTFLKKFYDLPFE